MSLPLTSKLMLNLANDEQIDFVGTDTTEVLSIAISSLQLFVQQNFIGPSNELIRNDLPSSNEIRSKLQINGIDINVNVENPELLLLSIKLFKNLLKLSPASYVLQWWYLRILYIYSEVLDEPSESLYSDFGVYSEELLKGSDNLSNETKALLVLEISQHYLSYKRVYKAKQHLEMAQNLLKTNFEVKGILIQDRQKGRNLTRPCVSGVLGVRTKFQQKALPQLSLKIEGDFEHLASNNVTHSETLLPKLLKHDDDVRLEKVLFQSDEENTVTEIPSLIQLLVLATVYAQIYSFSMAFRISL